MKKLMESLVNKLKVITTIDLVFKSVNILEKLFWASICLLGITYAIYCIALQIQLWDQNPSIISNIHVELSDLNYPAMTICPQGTTKNAIAERLGNYLDPKSDFLDKLPSLKGGEELVLCSLGITIIKILNLMNKNVTSIYYKSNC